jgi:hypothetical protein
MQGVDQQEPGHLGWKALRVMPRISAAEGVSHEDVRGRHPGDTEQLAELGGNLVALRGSSTGLLQAGAGAVIEGRWW